MVIFKKEIRESQAELEDNLLVIHRFFEYNNQLSDTKIKEFLTNSVYGCEIIITNVSSKKQQFRILWQIPEGALPLQGANYQRSDNKELNSYSTITFSFYFYFPKEGNFKQFPSNITIGDKVVSVSNKCDLKVVSQRKEVSFETFRDILASGENEAILNFLNTANLAKGEKGFNFGDVLWLLKDKQMFTNITDILRERRYFDTLIWNYGFYHKDIKTIREALAMNVNFVKRIGTFFKSELVTCTP
jgi:hypothetical protein